MGYKNPHGENDHGASGRGGGEGHAEPMSDGTHSGSHEGPVGGKYHGGKSGAEDSGGFDGEGHERRTGWSDDKIFG